MRRGLLGNLILIPPTLHYAASIVFSQKENYNTVRPKIRFRIL